MASAYLETIQQYLQQHLTRENLQNGVVELGRQPIYILAGIGGLYIASQLFSFLRLLLSVFVLPGESLKRYGAKGSWAVITGASDGIGKEFALQLAKKKFNVFLISRTMSKLNTLAQEIEEEYGVETIVFPMDFTQNKDSDYANLERNLNGRDISILINNVGQSHSIPVPFLETPDSEMNNIITVNCFGTLRITKLVAPKLVARRRGLIITMASMGGVIPTPLLATYSGSKAFLQQWSSALGSELAPHGVRVQLVQSYLVTSAMSKIRKTSALIPNPRQFVSSALSKIGRTGGAQGLAWTSTPYWSHAFVHWALSTFVGTANTIVVGFNGDMHESIRKRALKKAEREAKKQ